MQKRTAPLSLLVLKAVLLHRTARRCPKLRRRVPHSAASTCCSVSSGISAANAQAQDQRVQTRPFGAGTESSAPTDSPALVLLRERCCVQIYTLGERLLARNSWDEALEVHEARIRFAVE